MTIDKLYFLKTDDESFYCSLKSEPYHDLLPPYYSEPLIEGSWNNSVVRISGDGTELEIMSYDQLRWMGIESVVLPDGTRVALERWGNGKFDDMLDDLGILLHNYLRQIWPTLIDTEKVRPRDLFSTFEEYHKALLTNPEQAFEGIVKRNNYTIKICSFKFDREQWRLAATVNGNYIWGTVAENDAMKFKNSKIDQQTLVTKAFTENFNNLRSSCVHAFNDYCNAIGTNNGNDAETVRGQRRMAAQKCAQNPMFDYWARKMIESVVFEMAGDFKQA